MSYVREKGDRSFAVPRTWTEGSWARSETKPRCSPFWINLAAVCLCVLGAFSIFSSGMDMKTIIPSSWSTDKQSDDTSRAKSPAPALNILGGLGKQVVLSATSICSMKGRHEELELHLKIFCVCNQLFYFCAGGAVREPNERHKRAGRVGTEAPHISRGRPTPRGGITSLIHCAQGCHSTNSKQTWTRNHA